MTGEGKRYEVTEVKAIRGTESKTIARKQQEGWELVTQDKGGLRTTMTFRRPKPKTPWQMWAAVGGVGVLLVGLLAVGALVEDDSDASTTDAAAVASAEQPAPEQDAEPSSATDPMICVAEQDLFGASCKFGQTAIYSDTLPRQRGERKLEITVGAPIEFTPSEDAQTLYDLSLHPVNVYFPITVKNTSPELALEHGSIFTEAKNAEQGGRYSGIRWVSDGDVDSLGGFDDLPVGESLSAKEGVSMTTLEGVELRVSIDGMSGYSITFTR
ncbi:hypothetical protein [Rhodococcus sp. Q]|uniref:hypothetical protein n=1 Tax=Rhodococcus sp. Q TaxID=2502252 RepID=UPI0010F6E2D4|nr:hypothetical protein [Rhodococcus sp. Q]